MPHPSVSVAHQSLLGLALAAVIQAACATSGTVPGRSVIADAIKARTGIDPRGLPSPAEPAVPPDVSLDDGMTSDEAVAIALWNNAAFQAALADLGIARADLVEARLLRNPILSLLFPVGPKQLEATLQWPVDALWQRPRRVAAAMLHVQAVGERLVTSGLALVADVRRAYIEAVAADQRVELGAENADLVARIASIADARLTAGDISELEARGARNDAAQVDVVLRSLRHERDLSRVHLLSLLGLERDPATLGLLPDAGSPGAACGTLDALLREALSARPDVRAAELAIDAAAERADWERSQVASLMALLDANSQGREGFEVGPGIGADLPLFDRNQGGRARAVAEVEQASRQYLVVRTRVAADLRAAVLRLSQVQEAAQIWDRDIVPSLEIEHQQAASAYTAGEIPLLALLDVSRRLVDARVRQLEVNVDLQRAAVALDQSVGHRCVILE